VKFDLRNNDSIWIWSKIANRSLFTYFAALLKQIVRHIHQFFFNKIRIDWLSQIFFTWRHTFKMAAMTSFQAASCQCCCLCNMCIANAAASTAGIRRRTSAGLALRASAMLAYRVWRQFLIRSAFVHFILKSDDLIITLHPLSAV